MFENIGEFFADEASLDVDQDGNFSDKELKVAACVLLIEAALADFEYPEIERQSIVENLMTHFSIKEAEAQEILDISEIARQKEKRLSRFIAIINKRFSDAQKQLLYAIVWKVFHSDGVIDPRERAASTSLGKHLGLSLEQEIEARRLVIEEVI